MYPLAKWNEYRHGYEFGEKTTYSAHHLGLDHIVNTGVTLYAPFSGVASSSYSSQSGNMVTLTSIIDGKKYVFRFMHLSKILKTGQVKQGDKLGLTGNTGLSSAPHLHTDISKNAVNINNFGNFVDPEKFNWEADVSLKDNLTKDQLKKLQEAFFVKGNNTITVDDKELNSYLVQPYSGKKLGEQTYNALFNYLYTHPARKAALLERRLMIQENEKLKKQLEKCKVSGDKAYEALTTLEKIKALLGVK